MLKNKSKLIALITAFTLGTGLITPIKAVKADEITMEAVQTVEDSVLEVEDITENNKVIEILSFNDFHGNVLESGKNIGSAKLAGIIKEYQEKVCSADAILQYKARYNKMKAQSHKKRNNSCF